MHENKANDRSAKLCRRLSTKVGWVAPFNLSAFLHNSACYTSQEPHKGCIMPG